MKGKAIRSFVIVFILMVGPIRAQKDDASEDRFDVLAKSISPIVALLTTTGSADNHALNLQASMAEVSGLPGQLIGAPVHVAFEFPDKLLVQFPTLAGSATICRDRQTVWAFPASQFGPLVEKVGIKISTKPLPPFRIDEMKAVLLPALFDVHDAGLVKFGEQNYRVLDVRLIPELKGNRADGWPVRLWIHPTDHRVAQITLRSTDWNATLTVDKLELAPTLPPSTWQPTPEQHDQVMAVPGEKIGSLLQLALKQNK
jgi:hypothetical protein